MVDNISIGEKLCICPAAAKRPVQRINHIGICTLLHPYIFRFFNKNSKSLYYRVITPEPEVFDCNL